MSTGRRGFPPLGVLGGTVKLLIPLVIVATAASLFAQTPVARVGGVTIAREILEENVARLLQGQYQHTRVSEDKLRVLRIQELAALIRRQLLVAAARDRGLALPLAEARRQVAAMEKQLGPEEYRKSLEARGWTRKDHERALAETLLAEEAYRRFVLPRTKVSEEDIAAFFAANRNRFQWPEALHLQHILLKVPQAADAKAWERRVKEAEALKARLASEDFAQLAFRYSEDGYRVKGGDLGWVHRGRLIEPLETAVWAARVGDLVGPIRSAEGVHLVRILARRPARAMTLEEAQAGIRQELEKTKKQQVEREFFAEVKKRHPVAILDASLRDAEP